VKSVMLVVRLVLSRFIASVSNVRVAHDKSNLASIVISRLSFGLGVEMNLRAQDARLMC
jgi:hypothetical protein